MDDDGVLQEISNLFDAADKDKNETLTRDEIANMMTLINRGVRPSDGELGMCILLMDKNKDGVISRNEFIEALGHWLGINVNAAEPSLKRKDLRGLGFVDRNQTLVEMANFFRQFSPVADFGVQQQLILSRERPELDISVVRHEFPVLTNEAKSEAHKRLMHIVSSGRRSIMAELYSLDWNVVLVGVSKVKELLSVVEIFHNTDEKFELATFIFNIFNGVTVVDNPPLVEPSNGAAVSSIIRRVCNLISPLVPDSMKVVMYTTCLDALHSYILGPVYGVHASAMLDGDVWHPDKCFTKQVVESEKLPMSLARILDDNTAVNAMNQALLRATVRCVGALSEQHANCLEGMLRIGFRHKIVALLQQPGVEAGLLRTALGTLAVLCGHTHTFISGIPPSISMTPKELFDILYTLHNILKSVMCLSFDQVDEIVLVNTFTVLRYVLPLLSITDELFQSLLSQLLHFLSAPWDFTREISRCVVVSLDVCLEEVLLVSPMVNKQVWDVSGFSEVLLKQLSRSTATHTAANSQLARACLCIVSTLFTDPSLSTILARPANHEFLRRAAYLLSSSDCNWPAMKFLSECFDRAVLVDAVAASNAVDAVFGLFHKFKTHSSPLLRLLGELSGPIYTTALCVKAARSLVKYLKRTSQSSAIFTADQVESISQLHSQICSEMQKGTLRFSKDLSTLTDELMHVMTLIKDSHISSRSSSSAYISEMVDNLVSSWKDKLNAAYAAGHGVSLPNVTMDMDVDGGVDSLLTALLGTGLKPGEVLIDVAVVPTWDPAHLVRKIRVPSGCPVDRLRTALSLEFRTDVRLCLNQKSIDGKYVAITSQHQLEEQFRLFVHQGGTNPVVLWVEPSPSPMFTAVQLGLPNQKVGAYAAIGLQTKGVALRELQQELEQEGRSINAQLLDDFYEYFRHQNVTEVTLDSFLSCLTSPKLGFSPASARALFHGFDTDNSGTLSLKEIGVGFAKLTEGSVDEKLMLIFQAYDSDRNGYLDKDELTNLIHVASGVPLMDAAQHAATVIQAVDKNGDMKLDMFEFRDAAFRQMLPLGLLWSEGRIPRQLGRSHRSQTEVYETPRSPRYRSRSGSDGNLRSPPARGHVHGTPGQKRTWDPRRDHAGTEGSRSPRNNSPTVRPASPLRVEIPASPKGKPPASPTAGYRSNWNHKGPRSPLRDRPFGK